MKNHRVILTVPLLVLLLFGASAFAAAGGLPGGGNIAGYQANNQVVLPGMPTLGKWMIAPEGTIAHWLGSKYQGKELQEPIYVILIDEAAQSAEEAETRLLSSCS